MTAPKRSRRKKSEEPQGGLIELKKLWKCVDPQHWYTLFKELAPENGWILTGRSIKGRCPYHDDTDPSFVINFDRGMAKCFGSCEKYVGDIISLVAKLAACSYSEALVLLNGRFGIGELLGSGADSLEQYHRVQEVKAAAAEAMRSVILEIIRENPSYLGYIRPAIAYLHHARNIPLSVLHALPVGVFAKPEHLKKHIPSRLHDGFDAYFSAYQSPKFWGSLCFQYNNSPGSISRFKFRIMDSAAQDMLSRFPSPKGMPAEALRALCTKDFMFLNDPYTKELGVFGLHHYHRMIGKSESDVYVTEGEFDALSVMAAQLEDQGRQDIIMLAAGGKSGTDLSFLREFGIRTLWMVQDHPAKNGDAFVTALLRSRLNHSGDSVNRPLMFKVFQWPLGMSGQDLDEAVQDMGYDAVSRYLGLERASYFLNAAPWATAKCEKQITAAKEDGRARLVRVDENSATVEVEKANIEDELRKLVLDAILQWFQCLHDPADRLAYAQKFAAEENVDIAQLDDVQTALYSLNTVDGVKERLKVSLKEHLEFAYYESGAAGNIFRLWSKTRHEVVALPQSDAGIESVVSQYVGRSILDWARSLLGQSPILSSRCTGKDPLADERQMHANVLFLFRQIVSGMTAESRQKSMLEIVGQGIHYQDLPPSARNQGFLYFVNGNKVYRAKYYPDSGVPVEWEFINSVVDGEIFFDLHPSRRWSAVSDVSDLYQAASVDTRALFNDLRTILDGWKFEHHDIMRDYLAAWILSIPVQKAVGQVNITFLTGESTSGKTSFVNGLLGGISNKGHEVPTILEPSTVVADATPAWVRQEMQGSSLLLGMDEAETQIDTDHGRRINEIQKMLFSVPTGGATTGRGGLSADQRTSYSIRMPVLLAGINMNSDPVFLTRVVVVNTKKDPTRQNLSNYINDRFTDTQLMQLRRCITVALLPHIPEICRRRAILSKKLAQTQTSVPVTSRFIESLLTVLTVYEMLGLDPINLYLQLIERNRSRIESLHGHDSQSGLLNAVLYTEAVKTALSDDGLTGYVTARSLIMEGAHTILNNSNCGIYLIAEMGWIVVVWRQVRFSILNRTSFRNLDEAAMKESVSKNSFVVAQITKDQHVFIQKTLGLSDIKTSSGYTVLDSGYLMTSEQQEALRKVSVSSRSKSIVVGNTQSVDEAAEPFCL